MNAKVGEGAIRRAKVCDFRKMREKEEGDVTAVIV
jgi:hypothetical protein